MDVAKFNRISSDEAKKIISLEGKYPVIGAVGNWRQVKGFVPFLKAAYIISREIESAYFILVGFGPQENKLRSLAQELGIYHRVIFLENSLDIPAIMASFDIAVQPSFSESFSNVLIEYMAASKPIVATKVGDTEVVIDDGVNGLLVQPNKPEELADSILYLCRNQDKAIEMGALANEKVKENWSSEKIIDIYQHFYQELVDIRKGLN